MNHPLKRLLSAVTGLPAVDPQLAELSGVLGVRVEELQSLPADPRFCYRPFVIRKHAGGKRQIVAPSDPLKRLQRRLLHGSAAPKLGLTGVNCSCPLRRDLFLYGPMEWTQL